MIKENFGFGAPIVRGPMEAAADGTLTVLMAGSERASLESVARLINAPQVRFVGVNDGIQAAAMLKAESFACVILALPLSGLTGAQVTELLRTSAEFRHNRDTYVIGYGHLSWANVREACLSVGMNAFLPTPLTRPQVEHAWKLFEEYRHGRARKAVEAAAGPSGGTGFRFTKSPRQNTWFLYEGNEG